MHRMPNSPDSRGASSRRIFELRPSRALEAAVVTWLGVASIGCLGANALPPGARLLCLGLVWGLALPGWRCAIALNARGSLRFIEHCGPHRWRIVRDLRSLRAQPSPHCLVVGPVVWLRVACEGRRFDACVVDRRLAAQLRLDASQHKGEAANC